MKKHRKLLMLLVLSVIFVCLFATPAFAITESEVQTQVDMPDCSHPVPDGTTGTVEYVDGHSWIHMTWDNGRTAPIDPEIDTFQGISATPPASSGTLPQALVVKEQEDEHELSVMA